jgi:hypothetical protein
VELPAKPHILRTADFSSIQYPIRSFLDFTDHFQFKVHVYLNPAYSKSVSPEMMNPQYFLGSSAMNTVNVSVTVYEEEHRVEYTFSVYGMSSETANNEVDYYQALPIRIVPFGLHTRDCVSSDKNLVVSTSNLIPTMGYVSRAVSNFPVVSLDVVNGCPPKFALECDFIANNEGQFTRDFLLEGCQLIDNVPCVYYGNGFSPSLNVVDLITKEKVPYVDIYTFLVIGGGATMEDMKDYTTSVSIVSMQS